MPIRNCKDLDVYNRSFKAAMEIFEITKGFPKEEFYSLTDQIRRSARSIPANIREGFAKRKYPDVFIRHLNDALGSLEETLTWLEFALGCGYMKKEEKFNLEQEYKQIGGMLYKLMTTWQKF